MQVEVLSAIDQFLASPAGTDYELLDGELYHMGSESIPHQLLLMFLQYELFHFVEAEGLGQVYRNVRTELGPKDQPIPDLSFVSNQKLGEVSRATIHASPDVVFEVLSDSTYYKDMTINPLRYQLHGIKEYHLIDADSFLIKTWLLGSDGYGTPKESQGVFTSTVLGCRIEIGQRFCQITKL